MTTLSIARVYQYSFDSHPNITLAITGACLNSLGDVVAQFTEKISRTEHGDHHYDYARTLRFFCYGFTISPLLGRWNNVLERRFPLHFCVHRRPVSGKVSWKAMSKRLICDQLVMAPIGLGLFLGSMGVMERRSLDQIKEKFTDLYKPALVTNWQVWPVAQLINFRYMPLAYRVPFQSSCGVFWTLYLSLLNAKEDEKQDRSITPHCNLPSQPIQA